MVVCRSLVGLSARQDSVRFKSEPLVYHYLDLFNSISTHWWSLMTLSIPACCTWMPPQHSNPFSLCVDIVQMLC